MQAGQCTTKYHRYLVDLMGFLDRTVYNKDTVCSKERLCEVVPDDVMNWMKLRTFGVENLMVLPEGQEFKLRSATLEVM